jgi:hypothetical protein
MPTFLSQIRDGTVVTVLRLWSRRPRILGSILGRGERFLSAAWFADPLWSRPSLLYCTNTARYVYGTHAFWRNLKCGDEPSVYPFVRMNCRLRLKCDGTRAETRFRLSAKRTSPFKSAGASVQSTTCSRVVRFSGSNAGYTKFRGCMKGTGYPLHSSVSPSLLPCVTPCAITFQLDSTPLLPSASSTNCHITKNTDGKADRCLRFTRLRQFTLHHSKSQQ